MSTATEAAAAGSGLQAILDASINTLSGDATLTFTQYIKQVIAADGFVFWVAQPATTLTAKGSLHYGTTREQEEDQTLGVNAVIFSSEVEITAFNATGAGILWIADWQTPEGATIRIAFSSRGPLYQQADVYHYAGFAVYPALQSQLIASAADLPAGPIVSNSVPLWISALANLSTIPGNLSADYTGYDSFLLPENIVPPYVAIHVEPGMTKAIQAFPRLRWSQKTGTSGPYSLPDTQLMQDMVRLTLYGLNNQQARQLLNSLIEYSLMTDNYGFMTAPTIQDEKRAQSEIAALAMKKTITMDISYYQGTADAIARQLILSATVSYQITGV